VIGGLLSVLVGLESCQPSQRKMQKRSAVARATSGGTGRHVPGLAEVPQLSQLGSDESGQPALFSPREQLTLDECFLLRESHGS